MYVHVSGTFSGLYVHVREGEGIYLSIYLSIYIRLYKTFLSVYVTQNNEKLPAKRCQGTDSLASALPAQVHLRLATAAPRSGWCPAKTPGTFCRRTGPTWKDDKDGTIFGTENVFTQKKGTAVLPLLFPFYHMFFPVHVPFRGVRIGGLGGFFRAPKEQVALEILGARLMCMETNRGAP